MLRKVCNDVWNPFEIDSLQHDVAVCLALVEMRFPSSFFNIMTHLLYHLMDEVNLCGPICIKWMYPVERYMKTLKIYVCNTTKPKGSMAQGYIRYECLGFIMKYLQMFGVM